MDIIALIVGAIIGAGLFFFYSLSQRRQQELLFTQREEKLAILLRQAEEKLVGADKEIQLRQHSERIRIQEELDK